MKKQLTRIRKLLLDPLGWSSERKGDITKGRILELLDTIELAAIENTIKDAATDTTNAEALREYQSTGVHPRDLAMPTVTIQAAQPNNLRLITVHGTPQSIVLGIHTDEPELRLIITRFCRILENSQYDSPELTLAYEDAKRFRNVPCSISPNDLNGE